MTRGGTGSSVFAAPPMLSQLSLPPRRREALALLAYVALALAVTRPLAAQLASALPLGVEHEATVPEFSLWNLWWQSDRLAAFGGIGSARGYWDAPMFHPHTDVLAFSEPMVAQAWIVAPLFWIGLPAALVYNVALLGSLVLNGYAGWRLLGALRFTAPVAWLGGGLLVMLPYVHQQLGVLPLVGVFGIVLTVLAAYRFGQRPSPGRGALLGAAFALTYLCSSQYGLFLAVLGAFSLPVLFAHRLRERRAWLGLLAGAVTAAVLCAPLVTAQLRVRGEHDFRRPQSLVTKLSTRPGHFARSPWPQLLRVPPTRDAKSPRQKAYFSGSVKWLLALVGVVLGSGRPGRRRWVAFCAVLFALSWMLSMGPSLRIAGFSPYDPLARVVPGFAQVRSLERFALFTQVAVALLAVIGVESLFGAPWRRLARGRHGQRACAARWSGARQLRGGLLAAVGVLAIVEVVPAAQQTVQVPQRALHEGWTSWLRNETPPDAVTAGVPFAAGPHVAEFEPTVRWLHLGMWHDRATVDGYSSFFPRDYLELRAHMKSFPSDESLTALRARGVSLVLVDVQRMPAEQLARIRETAALERAHRDERAGVEVYRLR